MARDPEFHEYLKTNIKGRVILVDIVHGVERFMEMDGEIHWLLSLSESLEILIERSGDFFEDRRCNILEMPMEVRPTMIGTLMQLQNDDDTGVFEFFLTKFNR